MWIDNSLHPLFDEAISQIQSGGTFAIIDKLCRELSAVRDAAHLAAEIPEFRRTCQSHPIWQLLMEDPYTRRAFEKPRGYAGDAVMLDFVYSGPPLKARPKLETAFLMRRPVFRTVNPLSGVVTTSQERLTKSPVR